MRVRREELVFRDSRIRKTRKLKGKGLRKEVRLGAGEEGRLTVTPCRFRSRRNGAGLGGKTSWRPAGQRFLPRPEPSGDRRRESRGRPSAPTDRAAFRPGRSAGPLEQSSSQTLPAARRQSASCSRAAAIALPSRFPPDCLRSGLAHRSDTLARCFPSVNRQRVAITVDSALQSTVGTRTPKNGWKSANHSCLKATDNRQLTTGNCSSQSFIEFRLPPRL